MGLSVSEEDLAQLETDYTAFIESERKRYERDAEFLAGLKVSDHQTAIDLPKDIVAQLADTELTAILQALADLGL